MTVNGLPPRHGHTDGLMHVAAAALVNADGEVLLSRRHADSHQGGLWEFPGGKLEAGESVEQALRRELHEELGVGLGDHRPLIRIIHHYDDRSVLLDVHLVHEWFGQPHGREEQPLAWVLPEAMRDYPMPAADVPIVNALRLPSTYLITPPELGEPGAFMRRLEHNLQSGASLLQLRLFGLPDDELVRIGRDVRALCHAHHAGVLLNGDPAMAEAIGVDGLHLNSRALYRYQTRPLGDSKLLAVSCHSLDDLRQAHRLAADFAMLSPVLPTRSHPDADPLGWEAFAALADEAQMPVYALGGMSPELLPEAWQHGAQGVAGIRGLWADDPAR